MFDDQLVKLYGKLVIDKNTAAIYEVFCKRIEILSEELHIQPLEAEERIFSSKAGTWRK